MDRVLLSPDAAAQLDDMPIAIHARMLRLLERLADWPNVSGAKRLSGKLSNCYRLRTGDYRMQFRVLADRIIVEKIGHRDGFYED